MLTGLKICRTQSIPVRTRAPAPALARLCDHTADSKSRQFPHHVRNGFRNAAFAILALLTACGGGDPDDTKPTPRVECEKERCV